MATLYNSSIAVTTSDLPTRIAYDSNGREQYIGIAAYAGAASSDPCWMIKKLNYNSEGRVDRIEFADNNAGFTKKWSDRTSYTYGPSGDTI